MSLSQRTADEREQRKGLVLGLTLAEVLLLLLFLLMLALGWRMALFEKQASDEHDKAQAVAAELIRLKATLGSLSPLLEELKAKAGLDLKTVQELADRIARADALADENTKLKQENSALTATLNNTKLIGLDPMKLNAIKDALAAAAKINPSDPPEVLTRAVEVLRRLGTETKPDQVAGLSELVAIHEKLKALEKALGAAVAINPNDPVEAIERALEVLKRAGPDTQPDQITPTDQVAAMKSQSTRLRQERDNLMRQGKGLTYPSCWMTTKGYTEYIFDIIIRDGGLIVQDATPSRADDPDMKRLGTFARNELINEGLFKSATLDLYQHSKELNCRYYAIIRDGTEPTSKERYIALRNLVEDHFYPLHVSLSATVRRPKTPAPSIPGPPIGGPLLTPASKTLKQ